MNPYVPLKTQAEMGRLRLAAQALDRVFEELTMLVKPGVATIDLERVAQLALTRHGLEPELVGFDGYPFAICASPNNIAAHGMPGDQVLHAGDLVTIDISGSLNGWMADAAWTVGVGSLASDARRVLRAAWRTTIAGARAAVAGGRMGDIGAAIHAEAGRHGCTVVREFTGHGIGTSLHEPPVVPNEGRKGEGVPIVPGMVFNIEPVVCAGVGSVTMLEDGWSFVTADGSISAQYEITVAVRSDGTSILNLGGLAADAAPREPPRA